MIRGCVLTILLFGGIRLAHAASLSVAPSSGTFAVDSTFEVALFLNTESEIVNAISASLSFPADKLQLVSPAATQSIIELWTAPPRFNNKTGQVDLQGGIPGGVNVSNGLVIRLTFRVKSVGTAVFKYLDNSKVLRHDGLGTDVLLRTSGGIYELTLPPPAGPQVVSATHPDQSQWYRNANVSLRWAGEPEVEAYSYVLSAEAATVPDDIPEGITTSVSYPRVSDGINYFHIKSLRAGAWGGVTHFSVKVDTTPPAQFPIQVISGTRTVRRQPLIHFSTTDSLSGVDHYEIKLVPLQLQPTDAGGTGEQPFFIEAQSPYISPPLELGTYDVIVRVYDQAKNIREVVQRLAIVTQVFRFISDRGLEIRQTLVLPWPGVWVSGFLLLLGLGLAGWRAERWHRRVHLQRTSKTLPGNVQRQLDELKRYRTRYGKFAVVLLWLGMGLLARQAYAQVPTAAVPPLVTTVSRFITNDQIFYIGGRTQAPQSNVIIYLQNLSSGETQSLSVQSNPDGEWFYRHGAFLSRGDYLLWVQGKVGVQLSAPSPQVQMTVRATALQFGVSRISFETLYLGLTSAFLVAFLIALGHIVVHGYLGRRKHHRFLKEMREAEESVRSGFAVLRRDIQAELDVIHRAKLSKELSVEERQREEQLLKDLAWAEQYIGKEIWDVEEVER